MRLSFTIAFASLLRCKGNLQQIRNMAGSSASVKTGNHARLTYMDANLSKLVDDRLMSAPGFSIDQLMELAGYGVASAVLEYWEKFQNLAENDKNVLIFCGPGNNGGDGLVAARHLRHFGLLPTVVYPKRSKSVLFTNLTQQLVDLDIEILDNAPNSVEYGNFGLAIDALFGFSFQGPSREPYTSIISTLASSRIPVFSVDIPSGWDVNEGDIHDSKFVPDAVISLTAPKLCMKNYAGVHYVGGRFVPPKLAAELGLVLPDYGTNSKQVRFIVCIASFFFPTTKYINYFYMCIIHSLCFSTMGTRRKTME